MLRRTPTASNSSTHGLESSHRHLESLTHKPNLPYVFQPLHNQTSCPCNPHYRNEKNIHHNSHITSTLTDAVTQTTTVTILTTTTSAQSEETTVTTTSTTTYHRRTQELRFKQPQLQLLIPRKVPEVYSKTHARHLNTQSSTLEHLMQSGL